MIEFVSRSLSFDNLVVEVSVYRYICNDCGTRECFHDSPTPYPDSGPKPWQRGWVLASGNDDEQECFCKACAEQRADKVRASMTTSVARNATNPRGDTP